MKNVTALLFLFSMLSCTNTADKAVLDLIKQNNNYYAREIEEYKMELEQSRQDYPRGFDEKYFQKIESSAISIKKLKTKVDYTKIFEMIKGLGYELKIGETIKAIPSDDVEVLKNNLYGNLLNVIHTKKVTSAISESTHCGFGDLIKVVKNTKNDSVSLDMYTYNFFQVAIDDDYDDQGNSRYQSKQQFKIWSIKYKPKSKNAHCTGRIFFKDPWYRNTIMVQEFDDRKALEKNPFDY